MALSREFRSTFVRQWKFGCWFEERNFSQIYRAIRNIVSWQIFHLHPIRSISSTSKNRFICFSNIPNLTQKKKKKKIILGEKRPSVNKRSERASAIHRLQVCRRGRKRERVSKLFPACCTGTTRGQGRTTLQTPVHLRFRVSRKLMLQRSLLDESGRIPLRRIYCDESRVLQIQREFGGTRSKIDEAYGSSGWLRRQIEIGCGWQSTVFKIMPAGGIIHGSRATGLPAGSHEHLHYFPCGSIEVLPVMNGPWMFMHPWVILNSRPFCSESGVNLTFCRAVFDRIRRNCRSRRCGTRQRPTLRDSACGRTT